MIKVSINAVFKNFIKTMKEQHLNDVKNIKSFISLIDVVINNAEMAKNYGYCKPTIDNKHEHSFVACY